jgi:hypothetical protein
MRPGGNEDLPVGLLDNLQIDPEGLRKLSPETISQIADQVGVIF